jgi:hypothetical protein
MKASVFISNLLVVLALVLSACASPATTPKVDEAATSIPQSNATAQPTAEPTAVSAATPTPEPPQQIGGYTQLPAEPPPPADYADIVLAKVEAGEITYERGLIAALKLYAGDASGLEVLGDVQPLTGEGNVLLGLVHEYLATGSDTAAKAELQRLLNIIAPSPEQLLRYAAPEPKASGGPRKVAARLVVAPPDDAKCQELWAEGFPEDQDLTCILYTEVTLTNGTGRVFYPATWQPSDPNLVRAVCCRSDAPGRQGLCAIRPDALSRPRPHPARSPGP